MTITCRQKADRRLQAIQLLLKLLGSCMASRYVLLLMSYINSLSVLTAIVPGEPVFAGFIEAKDDGNGGDSRSNKTCKAPVRSYKTPNFLQATCPFCHPTNSVKALKGIDVHVVYQMNQAVRTFVPLAKSNKSRWLFKSL